jgi:hypothetical protein
MSLPSFLTIALVALQADDVTRPQAEQSPPQQANVTAELFGAGVFSTGDYELPPTFTKDGRTAYFTIPRSLAMQGMWQSKLNA